VQEGREVAMAVIRAAVEMIEKRKDNEKAKADGVGSCCVVS
jgi:hypothetical protein